MTRTYTLDADMCDEWVRQSIPALAADRPLVDAIRAQQPKPRIPWQRGLLVRPAYGSVVYRCCEFFASDGGGRAMVDEEGNIHPIAGMIGFGHNSFDPGGWVVVG